jgi:hypothetical protein
MLRTDVIANEILLLHNVGFLYYSYRDSPTVTEERANCQRSNAVAIQH